MDSKELFSFNDAQKKQEDFLQKLNEVKIEAKIDKQKKVINNLNEFYHSWEEVVSFSRDYTKMILDANHEAKQDEASGKGLKILTPKQLFQKLPIALAQVKAGNISENVLSEISQTVYSLYQSKKITKKV